MAELTAARNNALPYPVYGLPWVEVFTLLDADGDPVSPSSPDSEVSKNGDTAGDCTNEAVEISGLTGVCHLVLTATEMTADIVAVEVTSLGAKTTTFTLFPRKLAVLASGTAQGSNDTGDIILAANEVAVDSYFNGCLCVATIDSVVEARIINDYAGATKTAEVSPAWVQAQPDSNDTYVIYAPEGRSLTDANVASVSGTTPMTTTDINAEVVDALATDTYAEPGQGAPGATVSLAAKINYLYKAWRNKKDNSGTEIKFYADNGSTVDHKATVGESGGTVTKGEIATGA